MLALFHVGVVTRVCVTPSARRDVGARLPSGRPSCADVDGVGLAFSYVGRREQLGARGRRSSRRTRRACRCSRTPPSATTAQRRARRRLRIYASRHTRTDRTRRIGIGSTAAPKHGRRPPRRTRDRRSTSSRPAAIAPVDGECPGEQAQERRERHAHLRRGPAPAGRAARADRRVPTRAAVMLHTCEPISSWASTTNTSASAPRSGASGASRTRRDRPARAGPPRPRRGAAHSSDELVVVEAGDEPLEPHADRALARAGRAASNAAARAARPPRARSRGRARSRPRLGRARAGPIVGSCDFQRYERSLSPLTRPTIAPTSTSAVERFDPAAPAGPRS